FFWKLMRPGGSKAPAEALAKAITNDFGGIDNLQKVFSDAAKNRFGSGWAWLIKSTDGKLSVTSTPNQDNTLMDIAEVKGTPVLGIDVWEHAYYLHYQNKRADYVNAWWNLINWDVVLENYNA
ncbi:MAG TPA: superoxide dismutase, partial [Bacteroidia bacterium]|nr:superoxide dismutase [Bacteroidia bacterium]